MNYKIAHDQVWTNQTFVFENYLSFTRRRSFGCETVAASPPSGLFWQLAQLPTLARWQHRWPVATDNQRRAMLATVNLDPDLPKLPNFSI